MPPAAKSSKSACRVARPHLARIQQIHRAVQAGEYPNCATLAKMLDVANKTVQRDIAFMRDHQDLPLEFDRERNGYYYTQSVGGVPAVQVTEGEVIALYVAQKVLHQYQGTLFGKPLTAAFEKLTAGLQDTISFPLDGMDDSISFKDSGTTETDLATFAPLHQAVTKREEIEFEYKSLRDPAFKRRQVQPYHLLGAINCWYLIGFDRERADFRMFSLLRIRHVEPTGETFTWPADFDPKHLLRGSMGVYMGKGVFNVSVRFDPFASQLIRERQWHESQQIKELPDDEIELSMTLSSLFEVERWVLSWGAHARVVGPPELLEQVQAKVEAMAGLYRADFPGKPVGEPVASWDHDSAPGLMPAMTTDAGPRRRRFSSEL